MKAMRCLVCGRVLIQVFGSKRKRKCCHGKCERRLHYLNTRKPPMPAEQLSEVKRQNAMGRWSKPR